MKKTEANRKLSHLYELFSGNISKILYFKLDLPNTLEYLKLEKALTTSNMIVNGKLTKEQIVTNEGRLREELVNIEKYPEIIYSMSLVYIVSSFEVFLKNSIKLLLVFDNQILKNSDKKISHSEIFSFSNYDDLSNHIAEKYVYDLSYKSIIEQIKFLNEKIHVGLSFKEKKGLTANRNYIDLEKINEIFSTRNILLHNGGKVNDRYIELNPNTDFKMGDMRTLNKDYLIKVWGAIRHNGEAIYRQSKLYIKNKKNSTKNV